ncbi:MULTISPECIES: hypothetical protein [unclassified Beijerinckia]|uniref:hypothetical protein n=1 Tax=unclassified Beijerinckia TaxID=2638183 RepID=UPI0008967A5F|nr:MULTISPECIES: hypothetical protein [unclassified Beijerinckia]MDH7797494.1 hypothetical protein [Beijerinckia sp. GAS462]SEC87886.1 hypothetical protein SAMN05443249_3789 [Beijerinckia sp. 28-YEA-48]
MATVINTTSPNRFHNVSDAALADMLGAADVVAKAAKAELDALKAELQRRKLTSVAGAKFLVTCTEQLSARLDTDAVRKFLGVEACKFEVPSISNVIRVKVSPALALAA